MLALLAARDRADYDEPSFTRAELLSRWRTDSFDPREDARLALYAGAPAGYTAVFDVGALAFVHPEHERVGVGTALLEWTEERQRALGHTVHRQRAAVTNELATELFTARGYTQVRTVWQMARELGGAPPHAPVPAGIQLRPVDPAADAHALHAADEAAFAVNPDYTPEGLDHFCEEHLDSPQLDRTASLVAHRDGAVAGYVLAQRLLGGVGYIDLLAVLEPERRRGLGRCLLTGALGAFARAGLREAVLEVASDNPGATRLYEWAGLERRHGIAVWEKPAATVP